MAALGALLGATPACDEDPLVDRQTRPWQLTWADEFDGPAGSPPDPARWVHDVGGDGWGNAQLEFDTARTDNAALDGEGRLVITARREDYQGRAFTSARIKTQGLFAQRHGRFEARIKVPLGAGLWPAFWLLGDDIGEVGWPACGEIDVMEYRGQVPDVVHGTLHGPGYSGGSPISDTLFLDDGVRFADDFHVFAVEWDPGRIAWFVDDTLYHVATGAQLPAGAPWVFEHPFFIILNLAVGGTFGGSVDASTPFPAELVIDWVRVYERAP
ncbi:MAG: glycoside hydrolase family 16 protein [Deltaproteobacteria bacterium]|nr:glycoside hydrolase family 16 protein [Deltaproteobacteria bacterium]